MNLRFFFLIFYGFLDFFPVYVEPKKYWCFSFPIFFFGLFQDIIRKVECFFVFLTIPIKFLSCWVNFEIEEYRNEALILSAIKLLLQRELGRVSKHLSELVCFFGIAFFIVFLLHLEDFWLFFSFVLRYLYLFPFYILHYELIK